MAKPKRKYLVYSQFYCLTDLGEYGASPWTLEGTTWAVSEKQAINNIRHRNYGDYYSSQYKPTAMGSTWENGRNYRAIPA